MDTTKPTADVSVIGRAAEGRTLRDEVAIVAFQTLMQASKVNGPDGRHVKNAAEFPAIAFQLADAFMAARNVGQTVTFPDKKEVA